MRIISKLFLAIVCCALPIVGSAQTVILSSDFFKPTSFKIETEVVDSLSKEPITFASVYLKNVKDTIITNFALTDTLGKVALTEVTRGEYDLFVEYLGYKMYKKTFYIRKNEKLPRILLQEDKRVLEAAKVSAVGTAVEFRQDTVIYNAASFRSLAGDKLADLLKKMPGIEVGEGGDIKVNGKSVTKLTINGKTFFMGDNKAALDNLPAQFVDKVKVIDKEEDKAAFSGIKSGEKEKVMDVELKEEYKKGFFGNAKLTGGTSMAGDGEFIDDRRLLYDASTMISAYGEKNQFTAVANARNTLTSAPAGMIVFGDGNAGEDLTLGSGGLNSSWSAGANFNTEKVKGFEATLSAKHDNQSVLKHSRSERTTFLDGGDLDDVSDRSGSGQLQTTKLLLVLNKKDRSKYFLEFTPSFTHKSLEDGYTTLSTSKQGEVRKNGTEARTSSFSELFSTGGNFNFGVKKLGKERRVLQLYGGYNFQTVEGFKDDISSTQYASGTVDRDLHYINDNSHSSVSLSLDYVEPFGENWAVSASGGLQSRSQSKVSDAFNPDGSANDYYTSITDNDYLSYRTDLLAQYSKKQTSVQLGGSFFAVRNEIRARSYGLDTKTGFGEWQKSFSPRLNLNTSIKQIYIYASLYTSVSNPSSSSLVPTFNLVDPTRISLGNIYLRPSLSNSAYAGINGRLGKATLNTYLSGDLDDRGVISAIWFDENSVRYSIPVNSKKPSTSLMVSPSINFPLNESGSVSLGVNASASLSKSVSYQAKGTLEGFDVDAFDYSSFMDRFWGDPSGNLFYSGASGFDESTTRRNEFRCGTNLRVNLEDFGLTASYALSNSRSRYSLDSRANTNVWNNRLSIRPQYTTKHDFELSLSSFYEIRRGYGEGYDKGFGDIDLQVTKNFKAFSIGLIGSNLLNNSVNNSLSHIVRDNYYEDSYSLVQGRRLLLSFVYNFGKMNAANSRKAREASMMMSL